MIDRVRVGMKIKDLVTGENGKIADINPYGGYVSGFPFRIRLASDLDTVSPHPRHWEEVEEPHEEEA